MNPSERQLIRAALVLVESVSADNDTGSVLVTLPPGAYGGLVIESVQVYPERGPLIVTSRKRVAEWIRHDVAEGVRFGLAQDDVWADALYPEGVPG